MLAQFALVVFALCAVLSLIVDMGYARLTQGQMQNAADAAALEGLRLRDVGVFDPAAGQTVDDPFASDCLRRAAANRVVHWIFDDDFNLADGDPDYQFGAGPIVDLTEGVTNLHALQTMSVPEVHVYKPDLQLNQRNQVHGDMVSGRFDYTVDPTPSEDSSYARTDFVANPTSPQPPGGLTACPPPDEPPPNPWPLPSPGPALTGANDRAFLVRLRRSNDLADFPGDTENVASSGPSLPLTFGKGTTIFGDDPSRAYSPRRDGVTVRAAAIAETRPALRVGLPQANPGLPGVTPFALADTFVQTVNQVGTAVTINPANGLICTGAACVGAAPANGIGRFIDSLTDPTRSRWTLINTVGQPLPAPTTVACALATAFAGFGPVYSQMTSGSNRIIGFTRIGLGPDPARLANPCAKVIQRGISLVAASNATASLPAGLPLPATAQPTDVQEVLDKNCPRTLASCPPQSTGVVNYAPVLVPVLAR